jgi:hypothetical protein
MEVFSDALYLAHPELDRAKGVGLLTERSTYSRVNFVSVDRFICCEFDNHPLEGVHDTIDETCFNIM